MDLWKWNGVWWRRLTVRGVKEHFLRYSWVHGSWNDQSQATQPPAGRVGTRNLALRAGPRKSTLPRRSKGYSSQLDPFSNRLQGQDLSGIQRPRQQVSQRKPRRENPFDPGIPAPMGTLFLTEIFCQLAAKRKRRGRWGRVKLRWRSKLWRWGGRWRWLRGKRKRGREWW